MIMNFCTQNKGKCITHGLYVLLRFSELMISCSEDLDHVAFLLLMCMWLLAEFCSNPSSGLPTNL